MLSNSRTEMSSGPLVSFELKDTAPTKPIGYKAGFVAVATLGGETPIVDSKLPSRAGCAKPSRAP